MCDYLATYTNYNSLRVYNLVVFALFIGEKYIYLITNFGRLETSITLTSKVVEHSLLEKTILFLFSKCLVLHFIAKVYKLGVRAFFRETYYRNLYNVTRSLTINCS